MNFKDDHDMAVALAIGLMKGEMVAYRAPNEQEVHLVEKTLAEKQQLVLANMVGVDLDGVAIAHQWDERVIPEAKEKAREMGWRNAHPI